MNAPASSGTSDSGAAAGSDTEQGSESSGEQESTEKSYTVTLTSANEEMGTVKIVGYKAASASVTNTVTEGTQLTIKAIPETGYEFDSWSDGSEKESRSITVNEDVNLTATFKVSYN